MSPTVTDYGRDRWTLLLVPEIILKACAVVILNQIIRLIGIRTPDGSPIKYSAHCVKALDQYGKV